MPIIEQARAWLLQDPDQDTRQELEALLAAEDRDGLHSRFGSRLQFGTAGLRGELGAGPGRMNRVVVAQAALAIAEFLKQHRSEYLNPEGQLSVVIGYDARHNSSIFALDSARIFSAAGIQTKLFDFAVPTPVVAFTGRRLGSSAAIVVTASHNPPRDNGYKVYLGGSNGGSQLISPADNQIAQHIERIAASLSFAEIAQDDGFEAIGHAEQQAYIDHYRLRYSSTEPAAKTLNGDLKICYTAMHGVGWATLQPLFTDLGFTEIQVVREQIDPDPDFPTVKFPNPEEPGAMDLSFQTATESKSDLIIANDPDADRLAIGIPQDGGWRMLTGDEVGLILAEQVANRTKSGVLANSIVSSSQMARVAEKYNLKFTQTLTGFKWISKVPQLAFGYEEALGYCVDPEHTPDKDGISAAAEIAVLASKLKAGGSNLEEWLEKLGQQYGYVATGQISIRVEDLAVISQIMSGLRAQPPTTLAGMHLKFTDLALGGELPPTDGLLIVLEDHRRVIIRPSGTEPKLKCYLQAAGKDAQSAQSALAELRAQAEMLLQA